MLHLRKVASGTAALSQVAAFGILLGFQIAQLHFAFSFRLFRCVRLLVHMVFVCVPFTGVLSQIRREVTRETEDFWTEGTPKAFANRRRQRRSGFVTAPTGRSVRLFTSVDSRDSGDTAQEFTDC